MGVLSRLQRLPGSDWPVRRSCAPQGDPHPAPARRVRVLFEAAFPHSPSKQLPRFRAYPNVIAVPRVGLVERGHTGGGVGVQLAALFDPLAYQVRVGLVGRTLCFDRCRDRKPSVLLPVLQPGCRSTVLPVRGGATIRPRWPLPSGDTRSMTRPDRSFSIGFSISIFIRASG